MTVIDLSCSDASIGTFSHMFCVFTNDVTGSVWLSLAAIFIVLYIIGIAWLKVPSEICMALLIPFSIVGALMTDQWVAVIGALSFYFTFLIVKNIF